MGIIGKIITVGTTAVAAYMIGYHFSPRREETPCTTIATDWKTEYATQLQKMEEKYAHVPATSGIATPSDLAMNYVISENPAFKGITFTDTATGKEGIITKTEIIGEKSFGMQFASLDALLLNAAVKTPLAMNTVVKNQSVPPGTQSPAQP